MVQRKPYTDAELGRVELPRSEQLQRRIHAAQIFIADVAADELPRRIISADLQASLYIRAAFELYRADPDIQHPNAVAEFSDFGEFVKAVLVEHYTDTGSVDHLSLVG